MLDFIKTRSSTYSWGCMIRFTCMANRVNNRTKRAKLQYYNTIRKNKFYTIRRLIQNTRGKDFHLDADSILCQVCNTRIQEGLAYKCKESDTIYVCKCCNNRLRPKYNRIHFISTPMGGQVR